ncbi:hypothetical protein [Streptomyces sp. CBMA123]|uniref:hypothetical protein n=1 Tax=Streptomyces sp. CBMA123 TaxID=1896313 RepID=UPI0016620320|nr:hypothetical protein [Streptomyces sp. CBMA123]MBD0694280.1 hypothetical protein [Streptomyces sp. CBMA123]
MRAVRLASTVATAAVLLAALTACGSKGGDSKATANDAKDAGAAAAAAGLSADPKAALAAAALVMQKAGNGKVAMTSPDASSPGGSGTADWKDPGKVALDVASDMDGKKLKIRVIGADAYVGGDDATTAALQGKHWVKVPSSEEMGGAFVVMGQMMNPVAQLTIAAGSGKLSKVGQESVDGVQTTHLRAVEDTATLVAGMTSLTAEQRQSVQKTLEEDGKTLTIDFWLNGKQELVKYQEYGDTNGEQKAVTVKYSDLGKGTKIEAPAAGDLGSQADLLKLFG